MSQPTLEQWLSRKPAGPKPKKRLRKVAKRNIVICRQYSAAAKRFKKAHPRCEICGGITIDVHHKEGRGENLLKVETWMSVCRQCHVWIHNNPSIARAKGFLK